MFSEAIDEGWDFVQYEWEKRKEKKGGTKTFSIGFIININSIFLSVWHSTLPRLALGKVGRCGFDFFLYPDWMVIRSSFLLFITC